MRLGYLDNTVLGGLVFTEEFKNKVLISVSVDTNDVTISAENPVVADYAGYPGGMVPSMGAIELLVEEGWRRSRDLHRFVTDNPASPAMNWSPKILFLAFLSASAQTAKFTGMDRKDFLDLCSGFFDNIQVGVGESQVEREEKGG